MRGALDEGLRARCKSDTLGWSNLLDRCTGLLLDDHVRMLAGQKDRVLAARNSRPQGSRLSCEEYLLRCKFGAPFLPQHLSNAGHDGAAGARATRIVHGELALPFRV